MLRILSRERKTSTATMVVAGSTPSESVDEYAVVVDDLSEAWEFVNATSSDDDEEDLDDFSFSEEEEEDATPREVSSGPSKEEGPLELGSPSSDISMDSFSAQLHLNHDDGRGVDHGDVGDEYDNYKNDDDGDEYDDGYDLDDELVPWGLSDKFGGRQRIRKLGKRVGPKLNKAKRLAYRYNRPGCVHGKHGFGVQHCYI
ncbi:unnamed protein product [Coffea canephora]|uniref:Uncharacterized protein n=1 Tax=Coffea canephora TaxID=49390 RepID=A0A068TL92_COFCA|nr:unnamed protein product [Coffea canephora]